VPITYAYDINVNKRINEIRGFFDFSSGDGKLPGKLNDKANAKGRLAAKLASDLKSKKFLMTKD
jgi:hypothetical protein